MSASWFTITQARIEYIFTLLKGVFDTKADASHTHTKNQITDFPTNVSAFNNDAGYLTSYTDDKVQQIASNDIDSTYEMIFAGSNLTTTQTATVRKSDRLKFNPSTGELSIGSSSCSGSLTLYESLSGAKGKIIFFGDTDQSFLLPNAGGFIALADDIKNGKLTIQKNGTNVAMFYANQSTNTVANITVPTKTTELTNDAGFTTNVGTITGIKMNGSTVGSSGVVDLGTVITAHQDISGKADKSATVSTVAWDSTNKKLTKTINGTTTDVVTGATILSGLTKTQVTTALGYTPPTSDTNTTYTLAAGTGDDANKLIFTPSSGSATKVTVPYATTAGSAPASDVYAWAKASIKPSYTLDEVSDGSTRKLADYLPLSGGTVTGMTCFNKTIHSDGGQHLYGGGATNSAWYKITLATNGLTPPSSLQWYMCSLSLDVGGSYDSAAKGRIELSYYMYWNGSTFVPDKVYGFASGVRMEKVVVYYRLTEPFIIYVNVKNGYTSLWVRNVTYHDSSYKFRAGETKVEISSAITVKNYTAIPISRLYTPNGTYLATNSSLVPETNNELYLGSSDLKWSYVYATKFIGALQGNADTATTASKLGSSNVGSATQPIYLSGGTATACTYTLGKSVPSDAVFTDHYAWLDITDKPSTFTPSSHTHGNIQNGGTLQTNDITIASGDKLVVTDSSDSSKIARASISFDGSTATKCLSQKGTWETFGTSNLTIGTTATTAMAGNTTVTNVKVNGVLDSDSTFYFLGMHNATSGNKEGYAHSKLFYIPSSGTVGCWNSSGRMCWRLYDYSISDSSTTSRPSTLMLGNEYSNQSGSRYGQMILCSKQAYNAEIRTVDTYTANRTFKLPDDSGTIALSGGSVASGQTKSVSGDTVYNYLSSNIFYVKEFDASVVFNNERAVTKTIDGTLSGYNLLGIMGYYKSITTDTWQCVETFDVNYSNNEIKLKLRQVDSTLYTGTVRGNIKVLYTKLTRNILT